MGLQIFTCEECGQRTIKFNPCDWMSFDNEILALHPMFEGLKNAGKPLEKLYLCPNCLTRYEMNTLGVNRTFMNEDERMTALKLIVQKKLREIKCRKGEHTWINCKCFLCGSLRDEDHAWNGCKCRVCGKTRDENHNWEGCVCRDCGKIRDEQHEWDGCRCKKCKTTRDEGHTWDGCKCTKCYSVRDEGHEIYNCQCTKCHQYFHTWDGCTCTVCGKVHSFRELNNTQHQCEICGHIESHNYVTSSRRDGQDTFCLSCSYHELTWGNDW